jgi:hypothetical protein
VAPPGGEAGAGALGNTLQVASDRWYERGVAATRLHRSRQAGISDDDYKAVAQMFADIGISSACRDETVTQSGIIGQ